MLAAQKQPLVRHLALAHGLCEYGTDAFCERVELWSQRRALADAVERRLAREHVRHVNVAIW